MIYLTPYKNLDIKLLSKLGASGGDHEPNGKVGTYSVWHTTSILNESVCDSPLNKIHI